jgi:DNA helicase HerA-like ATPase
MNRHGLIAGATGKGKTKTIQVFIRGVFGVLMKMLK